MKKKGNKSELDLDKIKPYPKNNLQKNLREIEKKYGNQFNIKYKKKIMPVTFVKKTLLYNNNSYYELTYDIPDRTTYLYPLLISFADIPERKINNNSYINNIHKTDKFSGSEIVNIALKINEVFGVKEVFINDGTAVNCGGQEMDLSLHSLIKNERTYYMKFGFDYYINDRSTPLYMKFNNINHLKKTIKNTVKIIKQIKIKDLIKFYNNLLDLCCLITKENNKHNFKIIEKDAIFSKPDKTNWFKYTKDPYSKIPNIINDCYTLLNILNTAKETYLYELLNNTFKDPNDCYKYNIIIRTIMNMEYNYIYNKKSLEKKFILPLGLLSAIRYSYTFCYKFY